MDGKALILYASVTGNTEQVATQFQKTLLAYGWSCTMVKLEDDTDLVGNQIFLDNFDLVLLGSPVISCAPSRTVSKHMALVDQEPPRLFSNPLFYPGSPFRPEEVPLGVVFATYSGESFGPHEALSTLDIQQVYLEYLHIDVIGRFACPGKKLSKDLLELVAQELGTDLQTASRLYALYRLHPDSAELQGCSEDAMALMQQLLQEQQGIARKNPSAFSEAPSWHWDLQTRPNQRDLVKADIFLQEVLEGYFIGENLPKPTKSVYTSIA
jgi:hypothetical protein